MNGIVNPRVVWPITRKVSEDRDLARITLFQHFAFFADSGRSKSRHGAPAESFSPR
jgi:hypothetical protein